MEDRMALIAMSGGVDSSVAAWLTMQAGYRCIGATMRLFQRQTLPEGPDDAADAESVANRLGFPFYVFDYSRDFRENVVDKFVNCYECGQTPNPCVDCNRYLKFGVLLRRAMALGCDALVTGHYARIRRDEATGRYLLCRAAHIEKDQSYFLYALTQEQLAHTLFPLGYLTKDRVREIAREQGFDNAKKQDSQDICFVPGGDYPAFLSRYTGKTYPKGDFLDLDGHVVGTHQGAVAYTLGQRRGLGLAMGAPVYVCGKDMEKNTVTVGPQEALFAGGLLAEDWNWFPFPALDSPMAVTAKTRSRGRLVPATVYPLPGGQAKVIFQEPQRAVTPGQAVVLYQDDIVVGGGTIVAPLPDCGI